MPLPVPLSPSMPTNLLLHFTLSVIPSLFCTFYPSLSQWFFPSPYKHTKSLSHLNEPTLDPISPAGIISLLMPLKLLKSSRCSPSPPTHLPPTPPSLQPDSASSLLYWHSQYKILQDLKLPDLMDIFSVLISLNLSAVFDTVYYSLILAVLHFLGLILFTSRTVPSLSFISSTFPLSVDIPTGSVLGLCSSYLANPPWLISSILSLLLNLYLQPRALLKYSVSCQASLSGLPIGNSVYSKLNSFSPLKPTYFICYFS